MVFRNGRFMRIAAFAGTAMLAVACCAHAEPLLFVGDGGSFSLRTFDATTGAPLNNDTAGGSLGFPSGIAFGPDGNVYVADMSNGLVDRFSGSNGAFIGDFVAPGSGLVSPSGIAFGGDGNLYVADYGSGGQSFIDVFNGTTGAFVQQLVAPGAGAPNGGLDDPNGIAFGPDGLYVSDQGNGVDVFDPTTGTFITVLVPTGGPGNLADPSGLVFGPNGNLFVTDETNGVVDQFNGVTGAFVGIFGDTSSLVQPIDLAFGPDGNLYVTDANGVEAFNGTTGASLGTFIPADGTNLDNAQYLAFSTPEPSTIVLFVGGLALIALFRFRSHRA